MGELLNIILELSDAAKKKAIEKFKKEDDNLTDAQITYYIDIFEKRKDNPVFTKKDIFQYKFKELEEIIDKNFPKENKSSKDDEEVDFKGSEDVVYNENGLLILLGDLKEKCIKYGRGYSWCISRKDQANMFFSYRMRLNEPVFYFVFDEDLPKEDKYHALVIYINNEGAYMVANSQNQGDQQMPWSDIEKIQPKLKGLKNLFKHVPLSKEEEDDYVKFKDPKHSTNWYNNLTYEEKSKYIEFGHNLTKNQVLATPKNLIIKYVTINSGVNVPEDVIESLPKSAQNKLKDSRYTIYGKELAELLFYAKEKEVFKFSDDLDLDVRFTDMDYLHFPSTLEVNGDFRLTGFSGKLPKNLKVKGDWIATDVSSEQWPDSVYLEGSLNFSNCRGIKELPKDLFVGNTVLLEDTTLEKLPDNFTVSADLIILYGNEQLKKLPSKLEVKGDLNLTYSDITDLPKDLKVGETIKLSKVLQKEYNGYVQITQDQIKESFNPYRTALNEFLYENRSPIKSGEDHDIFQDETDPNKLDRVSKKGDTSWVKVFSSNPDIFPTVYEKIDNGAKVEKLDTVKAQNDYRKVSKALDKDSSFEGILNMIGAGNVPTEEIKKIFINTHPDIAQKFKDFATVVGKVRRAASLDRVDAHEGNFGYSKDGKLKMLDY